ncbi:hypothetical protein B296_00048656 [Ensete ventricosum]|uniref:Uncharacterized protein n=1 Tax=Ensete ventricosum TaxID=4639 RepID=A0A426YTT0_ENSVE|nr:hypothetical protein B296_00048656 [Ensete ventricosum]
MIAEVSLRARNLLELSPRCDLLGLGDRPNLNSVRRVRRGFVGSSLRITRWVRVAVDGSNRFGRDQYGCSKRYRKVVLVEFCVDRLRFRLLLGLLFEGVVEAVKGVRWQ